MPKSLDIKKIFASLIKRPTPRYEHGVFNPERDWLRISVSLFIFVLVIGAFNFYLFFRINRGDVFLAAQESIKVETLDRTALRNIIDAFTKRAERFSQLLDTPPEYQNPIL